ncbi:hypothetical protein [Streptomyces sp900116325]|uniref:hypothetical protein n=1 Tax=Streptomyces sp. 900116325 TaxID=3154295 RepID=UPI0033B124B7
MPTPRIGDEKTCLALCREEKAVRIRRQWGGFLTGAVAAGPAGRSRNRSAPRTTSGSGVESRDRGRSRTTEGELLEPLHS